MVKNFDDDDDDDDNDDNYDINIQYYLKADHDSNIQYYLKEDLKYFSNIREITKWLTFLPGNLIVGKHEKLICNLSIEHLCVVHIKSLHQVLNHGLKLKMPHCVIKFNQSNLI